MSSIKFRLAALFCAVTVVLSGLAGLALYHHQRGILVSQLQARASALSENLAVNAAPSLIAGDKMQLSVLVATARKNPGVLAAAVLDHQGTVRMHTNIREIGRRLEPPSAAPLVGGLPAKGRLRPVKPIIFNGKRVGWVLLEMDTSELVTAIWELRAVLLAGFILFAVGLCLLFIKIIERFLSPLGTLEEAARQVGRGDLTVRVAEVGGREIRNLARGFNQMTQGLQSAKRRIEQGYLEAVMTLAATVEVKDPYTRGHCDRVAKLSEQIARQMGMDQDFCSELRLAGALHDLGKVGVAREILGKPGPLTPSEFAEMARHPIIAYKILEPAKFLASVREIILAHHERYDGYGYPNRLGGEDICLAGRIIALADAFDAMTSDRPYRQRLKRRQALEIIAAEKGRQFDPKVTEAFLAAQPVDLDEAPAASLTALGQSGNVDESPGRAGQNSDRSRDLA